MHEMKKQLRWNNNAAHSCSKTPAVAWRSNLQYSATRESSRCLKKIYVAKLEDNYIKINTKLLRN